MSYIELLRVGDDEDGHQDSIVDYSKLLSPKQQDQTANTTNNATAGAPLATPMNLALDRSNLNES